MALRPRAVIAWLQIESLLSPLATFLALFQGGFTHSPGVFHATPTLYLFDAAIKFSRHYLPSLQMSHASMSTDVPDGVEGRKYRASSETAAQESVVKVIGFPP